MLSAHYLTQLASVQKWMSVHNYSHRYPIVERGREKGCCFNCGNKEWDVATSHLNTDYCSCYFMEHILYYTWQQSHDLPNIT